MAPPRPVPRPTWMRCTCDPRGSWPGDQNGTQRGRGGGRSGALHAWFGESGALLREPGRLVDAQVGLDDRLQRVAVVDIRGSGVDVVGVHDGTGHRVLES